MLLLLLRMLDEVTDDDTAGADVAEQPGKIQGNAAANGWERGGARESLSFRILPRLHPGASAMLRFMNHSWPAVWKERRIDHTSAERVSPDREADTESDTESALISYTAPVFFPARARRATARSGWEKKRGCIRNQSCLSI